MNNLIISATETYAVEGDYGRLRKRLLADGWKENSIGGTTILYRDDCPPPPGLPNGVNSDDPFGGG